MGHNSYIFNFGSTYTLNRGEGRNKILTINVVGETEHTYILEMKADIFPDSWKKNNTIQYIDDNIRYHMIKAHSWDKSQIRHIGFWNKTCEILYGKEK